MTLDEAIKHCEEVADYDCYGEKQLKCAEEHRQLAEWLKELKRLREQMGRAEHGYRSINKSEVYKDHEYVVRYTKIADGGIEPVILRELVRCKDCSYKSSYNRLITPMGGVILIFVVWEISGEHYK